MLYDKNTCSKLIHKKIGTFIGNYYWKLLELEIKDWRSLKFLVLAQNSNMGIHHFFWNDFQRFCSVESYEYKINSLQRCRLGIDLSIWINNVLFPKEFRYQMTQVLPSLL
jgi:hypothetical protein